MHAGKAVSKILVASDVAYGPCGAAGICWKDFKKSYFQSSIQLHWSKWFCNCARYIMYNHAIIVTKLLRNFETGQMNYQLERGPVHSFAASSKGFQCCNALNSQQVCRHHCMAGLPIAFFALHTQHEFSTHFKVIMHNDRWFSTSVQVGFTA